MKKHGLVVMLLLVMMVSSVALAEITYFSVMEIPTNTRTPLMDWGLLLTIPVLVSTSGTICSENTAASLQTILR